MPLAERWDGSTWSIQTRAVPTGAIFSILDGVSCSSATNCMAVGSYGTAPGDDSFPAGGALGWQLLVYPDHARPCGRLGLPSESGVVPHGDKLHREMAQYQTGTVPAFPGEGWNGSTWTVQTMPSPSHVADLVVAQGVSCTAPGTCTTAHWSGGEGTGSF